MSDLKNRYASVRAATESICNPLEIEDYLIQSMTDASPLRWHLAHTTWFFETFILKQFDPDYRSPNEQYAYLFNSYYNAVGDQYPRHRRGQVSRPTVAEVYDYRSHVDNAMAALIPNLQEPDQRALLELGFNHEQQHQELMFTDLKHGFFQNPLMPVYLPFDSPTTSPVTDLDWVPFDEQQTEIGHNGEGFAFDNESPLHTQHIPAFKLANRLVTNAEYLEFMQSDGYETPSLWLSDGWQILQDRGWKSPLYWSESPNGWQTFTLGGVRDLAPEEPVVHISHYEADAFATWAGARLPTEAQWELAARGAAAETSSDWEYPHPRPANPGNGPLLQIFGDCWEWTSSPYIAYPGYKPAKGAVGEYNGKFMSNQIVLRGGSCVTPIGHIRHTYRNFFYPETRWQFSGIRLAR